jgi:hypothetical protein
MQVLHETQQTNTMSLLLQHQQMPRALEHYGHGCYNSWSSTWVGFVVVQLKPDHRFLETTKKQYQQQWVQTKLGTLHPGTEGVVIGGSTGQTTPTVLTRCVADTVLTPSKAVGNMLADSE